MTFASITLYRNNTMLSGYLMEDNTFQFLINGEMRTFQTLLDVWAAWADTLPAGRSPEFSHGD